MNRPKTMNPKEYFIIQKVVYSASKRKTKGDVNSLRKSLDRYKDRFSTQEFSEAMNLFKEQTKGIYHYMLVNVVNILQNDFPALIPPMLREERRDARIFNFYAASNYDKIFGNISHLCFVQNPTKYTFEKNERPTISFPDKDKRKWAEAMLSSENFEDAAREIADDLFTQSDNQVSSLLAFQFNEYTYILLFYYEKLSVKNMNAHHHIFDQIREIVTPQVLITETEEITPNETTEQPQIDDGKDQYQTKEKQIIEDHKIKLPNLDQ